MCYLASSCPLTPDTGQEIPGESSRIRAATFNTRCIVPEMDNLSVWTQIINGSFTTPYDRYRLRWKTNLTIVHGKMWAGTHALRLKCGDDTGSDWSGSDEVELRIWADGMLLYDPCYNDIGGSATDMDSDDGDYGFYFNRSRSMQYPPCE